MKKLLLLSFIIFITTNSFAQETSQMRVVGNGKLAEGEFVGSNVVDANQEICAGLIILSDLTGLSYTSYNGIVKIDRKPGRDLLFLSPTERVVEVYKEGYKPLKIILSEFDVFLKTRMVHQLEVTGDKKVDFLPVLIVTKPEGTEKIINGERKGSGTTFNLPEGKHTLRIEKSGYEPIEESINVNSNQLVFNYTLKEISQQIVEIRSEPKEAQIFIDGMAEGVTDAQVFRFPGTYKIRLTKSGYLDVDTEITVKAKSENKFTYKLTKNSGTINFTITPNDAQVEINNKNYGTQRNIEIAPGSHFVVIKRNGYKDYKETVNITLGGSVKKTINLEAITGGLQVRVTPIDAKVTLKQEGRTIESWTGAKIINNLIVGNYTLEAVLSGYETTTKQITITENKTTVEDITLKQITAAIEPTTTISKAGEPEMIFVEGGTFMMGSNDGDSDEKPIHSVTVSSFYIGKYEVTQKEWREVMGNNPSYFKGDNLPVEKVSWNDVQEFIRKLNQKTGQNYRLPTEAEWEYAARGGALTSSATGYKYSGSNNIDEVAWYDGNSGSKTQPVGTKKPNELGIYDMSGNVWEWCSDWYDENYYKNSPGSNPRGPSSGTYRVLRSGSWYDLDNDCRATTVRARLSPDDRYSNVGFRIAKDY